MSRHEYTDITHEQILDPAQSKFLAFPWRASGTDLELDDGTFQWFPQNAIIYTLGPTKTFENWGFEDTAYRVRICGVELWLERGYIYPEPDAVWTD
jgi:hypothetical protein